MTRDKVIEALQATGYVVKDAADLLGVHRVSLHRFMRDNGIEVGRHLRAA